MRSEDLNLRKVDVNSCSWCQWRLDSICCHMMLTVHFGEQNADTL